MAAIQRRSVRQVCQACGSQFLVIPSKIARGRGRFCSRKCQFPVTLAERFARLVGPAADGGCIIWGGVLNGDGYGKISKVRGDKRHKLSAHRAAWELANGPIPDGLHVLHQCDRRDCVNVDHLFLGTHQDNMADMVAKGRQHRGERSGAAKLTEDRVRAVRARYAQGGVTCVSLAREFGVSDEAVRCVVRQKTWKHVR